MEQDQHFPFALFVYRVSSAGGRFSFCSPAIEKLFQVSAAAIVKDPSLFFDLLPGVERERLLKAFNNDDDATQAKAGEFTPSQVVIKFKNPHVGKGVQTYFLQAAREAVDDEFIWTGAISLVTSDVKSLNANQARIQQSPSGDEKSQGTAPASPDYFRSLHDQLPDLFYYKDANSRFLGGNKAWKDFHGFTDDEQWLGKTDRDSPRFSEQDSENILNAERAILRSGCVSRRREHVMNPDGSEQFLDSIKAPIYDNNKNIIGLVGITRDITEQVNIEQALAAAKTAAEQAAIAKSSFLAVMSHEIRTPMNGVIGCASLLGETALSEEQQQLVRTIQSCGEGLLVIINDILDYSKIEAGQIILDVHSFHLRELIEDTLELFSKSAAEKSIELNYYIEPQAPLQLEGDSSRIRQVLLNLIGNSIKFTERGEVTVHVSLLRKNSDENSCSLLFTVRDTGIGISAEHQGNLFQVFTQADTSITRKYGGTGLGLAISKKIVQQMGGDIGFSSKLDKGTQFFFSIQVIYEDKAHEQQQLDTSQFKNLHALIVDDNTTNRKILAATLMQWGMQATAYASPENALENAKLGHYFDVAILDQQMPGMAGSELADRLKALSPNNPIPTIILSSTSERGGRISNFISLQKPTRTNDLIRALLRALKLGSHHPDAQPERISVAPKKTRVLVVEDNSVNQMVVAKMLSKLGYINITMVADGTEAVDVCQTMPIDIVLMDIQMRYMDGYTATEKIRAQKSPWPQPWIIALTAGVQQADTERAYASGMNAFATKPIQLEQLRQVLSDAEQALATLH